MRASFIRAVFIINIHRTISFIFLKAFCMPVERLQTTEVMYDVQITAWKAMYMYSTFDATVYSWLRGVQVDKWLQNLTHFTTNLLGWNS